MIINFLTANNIHIAKSYTPTEKSPYPLVSQFTSHSHSITTIEELNKHIVEYSNRGGCLLKGTLLKQLNNESRAGSTSADTPTEYIVIDIDRCSLEITSHEEFVERCLPECFRNVDYVWQWSNSAGITKPGVTGHLFFLLNCEVNVKVLKKALIHYNFLSDALESEIRLAHNGLTLTWGLDPTCAQNDKLIFIAPPTLIGIDDPHPNRIELVKRNNRAVSLNLADINIAEIETACKTKLRELRAAANLPRKEGKYKEEGSFEYLKNPEKAIFRGPYIDARGFRYGNLNNGDSYAYFHHLEKPKFLYNFKGEPAVRIQDIDPEYWQQLRDTQNPIDTGKEYYAFRDRQSDIYYTVIYDKQQDKHETFQVSNIQKAIDFLKSYRQPVPETLPIWDVVFEPTKDYSIDSKAQKLNLFQKTDILKNAIPSTHFPKKFSEVVMHVVGNSPDMRDELLNWLAFVIQRRTKAQTAFLLHGRTGTGKGVLFTKVIQKILGLLHCPMIMMDDIDHAYNEWVETGIIVVVDEAQISDDIKRAKKRINKIKNLITEPYTILKKKYAHARQIENHVNFIFTSNEHDSIWINNQDRRFKVCPRQEAPLAYTQKDIAELEQEIPDIANYLIGYPVNEAKVRAVPHNQAREDLITASQTTIDEFISILKQGNLDDLLKYHDEFVNSKNAPYAERYRKLTEEWQLQVDTPLQIPTSDLRVVYCYIFNTEIAATRFGKILASKGINNTVSRVDGKPTRTVTVTWKMNTTTEVINPPCPGPTANSPATKSALIN